MLQIYLQESPGQYRQNLFLIGRDFSYPGSNEFFTIGNLGDFIVTTFKREQDASVEGIVKPLFSNLEPNTINAIVQAFAEHAKKQGIEAESESKAKGKLEAQSAHLQDLRTLLKLK